MAKGDAGRAQNAIDYQGGMAQNNLNNVRGNQLPQNQQLQNRFNTSADQSGQDYSRLMHGYGDFINQAGTAFAPSYAGYSSLANNPGQNGYGEFAQTGGYSPQDIQDLRARAIAPTRAVYQNAQSNIDRQRALQGYSPNYTAATAHLTRGLADSISDANVNANASIADSIRQGKLAGMGGMAQQQQAGLGGMNSSQLAMLNSILGGMSGQGNLYGTAPGATSMFGQQLGQSNAQQLDLQQLQNQLGLGLIGSQINKSGIPGNYQQALGNIGSTLGLIGQVGSAAAGMRQ